MEWERKWQAGGAGGAALFDKLPPAELARLRPLALAMRRRKEEMQELASAVDAATHCAGCGGACCVSGKYHFTGVDLLVFLVSREPLFVPRFDNGLCPYLGDARCLIAAGYRPFNCITFICDLIEDQLPRDQVSRFYQMERELRKNYGEIASLFPSGGVAGSLL